MLKNSYMLSQDWMLKNSDMLNRAWMLKKSYMLNQDWMLKNSDMLNRVWTEKKSSKPKQVRKPGNPQMLKQQPQLNAANPLPARPEGRQGSEGLSTESHAI